MIDLYDNATHKLIGSITEADLKVLVEGLEEESAEDRDYYIDLATIDVLADGRATEHLVRLLREAVGKEPGVEIRWQRR
ncbi:MAG TPA: galactosyldiacylglycerol synthase [Candidatus Eisenbacteria bacterium]|jgi:hypothetical protein